MKLVFLYGPPAVGKLTVAKELAALTGYKVFHGHLTFDLAHALFEPFTPPFGALCQVLRLKTIELAAQYDLAGMIFTYCYAYPSDTPFVERLRATVASAGGEVCFVQLLCDVQELKRRVVAPDRRAFRKLDNAPGLEAALVRWDLYTPIPDSDTLSFDNTHLAPTQVAVGIVKHFRLDADER